MNIHEQRMCELQGTFFEFSFDRFSCGSAYFISRFMYSDLAKELDVIDDPYNFISPNNMVTIMKSLYPSLSNERGIKYPPNVLRWMGQVYRAFNIIKKQSSDKIYKCINAEKLLSLYDVYHTFSLEQCVDRLDEIIKESKPDIDDREIFRQIMNGN